jgi:predicted dehydrogenase
MRQCRGDERAAGREGPVDVESRRRDGGPSAWSGPAILGESAEALMRLLVIGTGSIGTRHCRNLVSLGHAVLAWDADPGRLAEVASVPNVMPVGRLEEAFEARPDAALICTPPVSHVALALRALEAGAHLLVEKPISSTAADALRLVEQAERCGRLLVVGFNLRFLPSLRRVKDLLDDKRVGKVLAVRAEFGSYLPDWRPGRDYRENYAVHAAQGGGILLDAIHELDYLGWLFGEVIDVLCTASHVSDLAGDTEDLAEVTLRFESGALAQAHLDYLQRLYRRNLQVIGDAGVITWDYATHTVTALTPDARPQAMSVDDGAANEMYLEEVRHFIRCLEGRESPLVDGREALRSLRLVEAAKASARDGRRVRP